MRNSTPKTQKILLRLSILTLVSQIIGIAIIFLLSGYLSKSASIGHPSQTTIFIALYVTFNLLSLAAVIINSLRPVRTIENYFSAKNNNILISNNLSRPSVIDDLIGDVSNVIAGPAKSNTSEEKQTSATINLDTIDVPVGVVMLDDNAMPIAANNTIYKLLSVKEFDIQKLNKALGAFKFSQSLSLAKWVAGIQSSKIRGQRSWKSVKYSTVVENQAVTRVFDIVAKYDKTLASPNISIVLIDTTAEYENNSDTTNLIAVAAHELRAPITIINGLVDTLAIELSPSLKKEHVEMLQRIKVSIKKLSEFVNNMLALARANQDELHTTLKQENWEDTLTQITNNLRLQTQAHGQTLDVEIEPQLPSVLVDKIGIEHVLTNLVDNAIKYSKPGGHITISSKRSGSFIETIVADQGIGIPEALMGNLFTKFYRSHRSKQAISGTGIGLYLCKSIMNMHGGEIWIKSVEGQGTTVGFTLQIPKTIADIQQTGNNDISRKESYDRIQNHSLNRG